MSVNRILISVLLFASAVFLIAADNPPPTPAAPEVEAELATAFSLRLETTSGTQSLAFDLFTPEIDAAFLTPDGKTAMIWLALRDDRGRLLHTEPGLALAVLTDSGWQVLLPGDTGWEELKATLSEGMLPAEQSPTPANAEVTAETQALTGYYLPYAAGTARKLEGSIGHNLNIPQLGYPSCANAADCWYAYDFGDVGHFPLLASKQGTVFARRDTCADGSPYCTNYIVVYNSTEKTYQIYLHLANGTIPDSLVSNSSVQRGQYLGDTDDTGYSTSNHVHFMVTKSVWVGGDGYYWGQSIDIRFADVPINSGMPRTCYEVAYFQPYFGATQCLGNKSDPTNPANDWFVSGNTGAFPPTGSLTRPAPGATVNAGTNPLIDVSANASDDVHVQAVRLLANLNGQWVEVGPKITQQAAPGFYDWDANLCDVGPLNGALEVALRVWDHEGNVTGPLDPRTINVDHACPPPVSQLTSALTFDSTAIHLSWTANAPYAAIGSFELQWRVEPGIWDPTNTLAVPAAQLSAWIVGQPNATIGLRLRAVDVNGQPEAWPANDTSEISLSLPNCTPDAFEPDDDLAQARDVIFGHIEQRNLCGVSNRDWFTIHADHAGPYLVSAVSLGGEAAVKLTIYAGDGQTVLASGESAGIGQGAAVRAGFPAAGSYYLAVEPLMPNLVGTGANYGITVWETVEAYLPAISR